MSFGGELEFAQVQEALRSEDVRIYNEIGRDRLKEHVKLEFMPYLFTSNTYGALQGFVDPAFLYEKLTEQIVDMLLPMGVDRKWKILQTHVDLGYDNGFYGSMKVYGPRIRVRIRDYGYSTQKYMPPMYSGQNVFMTDVSYSVPYESYGLYGGVEEREFMICL